MARKIVEEQPEPANDDYEEEVDSDEELEGEDDPNNYIPPHKLEAYAIPDVAFNQANFYRIATDF